MIQENINGGSKDKIQETSKNHTTRVGCDFHESFKSINAERVKNKKKQLSMNVLTNLLIKHRVWPTIIEDLINYDYRGKNEK